MSDSDFYQLLNTSSSNSSYYSSAASTAAGVGIWLIIACILSVIGGILVYFLFVKSKNEPKGKFTKWLKDFLSFKVMWIEPILKVVYYIATIFVILFSFTYLVAGGAGILLFFLTLILGPVLVRIFYEMTMMFIMIWRNTRDIANSVEKKK